MKVVPDMLDHPKFLKLKKRIGPMSAEYLLRIWGHCEANQKGELWIGADGEYVEIVSKFEGISGDLFNALIECGWVEKKRGAIRIHDWNATNSRAVTNWALGNIPKKRGGENRLKPEGSLGLALVEPSACSGSTTGSTTGSSPLNEGMNEGMNEDGEFNLTSQVSPSAKRTSKLRPSPLVDDDFIDAMKKIYQPSDVDRALARMQVWLKTPKGAGKSSSKSRFATFLKDSEPLSEKKETLGEREELVMPGEWRAMYVLAMGDECPDVEWERLPVDVQRKICGAWDVESKMRGVAK